MVKKWGDQIQHLEKQHFVGREAELELFRSYLLENTNAPPIINIYGTAGIGKSSLVAQCRTISEQNGIPFILLDSRDFSHTPEDFCIKLLNEMNSEIPTAHDLVRFTVTRLKELAENNRLVLTIDTYEEMNDLDHWLRESFIVELSDQIIVILAGRNPLQGTWKSSAAWRKMIRYVPLVPFDLHTSETYASKFNAYWSRRQIEQLHTLSHGHPLTLSLFMQISADKDEIEFQSSNLSDALEQALSCWLREIRSTSLRALVEAASMVRVFHQELLENVLDSSISPDDFDRLTGLSFILRSKRGWFIHDGLRAALSQNFKLRKPHIHRKLWERTISCLYREIPEQSSKSDAALIVTDLMYVLGDTTIRAAFLEETKEQSYYFETINKNTLEELETYIQSVLDDKGDFSQEFLDPETQQTHVLEIPKAMMDRALILLDPHRLVSLGGDVVRLLKNKQQEAVAYSSLSPFMKTRCLFWNTVRFPNIIFRH